MNARLDGTLMLLWCLVLALGLVMVASSSMPRSAAFGDATYFVTRHGIYLLLGVLAFALCALLPLKFWHFSYQLAWLAAVVLCVLVLLPGIGNEVNGARRWISLAGFTLQASEVAKFLLLVYLAGYLARQQQQLRDDVMTLLRPAALIALVGVLLLLQPDFGALVVIVAVSGGLMFMAGARLRHFLLLLLVAMGALALLAVAQPYRMQRLVAFLDPWSEAFGSGYQLTQALIAFGRGEWFGLGLGEGIQKLFYLPEAHNDFIFAVIAEELGLVGAVAVFGLLLWLVLRIFRVAYQAMQSGQLHGAYLAYGAGMLIGVQTLINVGVNTGMLPTKGLTLPFISYGGNSLLVCCALVGLVVRVQLEQREPRALREVAA